MTVSYKNTITAENANLIRAAVGFRKIHPEQLKAGLEGSAFITAAYEGDVAVGMARLIWDGGAVALIHDIIVMPEYRGRGIEAEMTGQIFDFLRSELKPGFGIQVDIRAWGECAELYEKLGFRVSTVERRGVPMHICLTDRIELTDNMFGQ